MRSILLSMLIVLIVIVPAAAQGSLVPITLLREPDMLTVYVQADQRASLLDLRFQYLDEQDREILLSLRDYEAFREASADVGAACFVLRTVETDTPIPQECVGLGRSNVFVQEIGEAGLFWFDVLFNLARPLVLLDANGAIGVCPAENPRCELGFPYSPVGEPPPPPLLFDPADIDQREILVLITEFEQISGNPLQPHLEWERVLDDAIMETGVHARAELMPQIVRSHEEARTLADQYGATLVIWGYVGAAVVNSQYTVTPRWSQIRELPGETEIVGSLDDLNLFVSPGGDVAYVFMFVMAQLTYFTDDNAGALSLIDQAIALAPPGREAEMGAGALYFFRGHVQVILGVSSEITLPDYDRAIELGYQRPLVYQGRAWRYSDLGDHERAIADIDYAIALDPTNALSYMTRGALYARQNDYEHALVDSNQAIALDPNTAAYYLQRGTLYLNMGDNEHALTDLNYAIELDSSNPFFFIARGTHFLSMREYARALTDLDQAIALDPANAIAYNARALLYGVTGDFENALADFDQAIALDPTQANFFQGRAILYGILNQQELAIFDLDEAIALAPTDGDIYSDRGDVYKLLGNYARALADFNQAIALDPTDLSAFEGRALIFLEQENYRAAYDDFTRVTELDPQHVMAYHWLTYINANAHRCQAAVEALRRYVELAGDAADPSLETFYREECG